MTNGIVASNFRAINKNTLIGSVDLEVVGWHLSFKECLWLRKGDREWINFPAKDYTDSTGAKKYINIIQFTDDAVAARFQKAALDAVHAVVGGP